MKGTISKIDDEKQGPLGRFIRVHFTMEGGGYRMLDLVKRFRNWRHWKEFLEVGISLSNLQGMGANKLDADPVPRQCFISAPESSDRYPDPPVPSKRHTEAPQSIPATSRVLSHQLKCTGEKWKCKCGYVLGTGHAELYAQCPLAKPKATYHGIKITGKPKPEESSMMDNTDAAGYPIFRPKKVAHVFPDETDGKEMVELFDFALKPRKKKVKKCSK